MQLAVSQNITKTLNKIDNILRVKFWVEVQGDLEKNLLDNIRPHSKTGVMERNAYVDIVGNGVEAGVRNNGMMVDSKNGKVNYATFVHFGSKPHTIEPSKKKSLRFLSGGKFAFAKKVNHPGYKGDEFLYNAAKETFNNLDRILNKSLGGTL